MITGVAVAQQNGGKPSKPRLWWATSGHGHHNTSWVATFWWATVDLAVGAHV